MRIALLTFYYPPDLSAGSFRAAALADAIVQSAPSVQLDVITTQPNRYHSFKAAAAKAEVVGNLRIHRIAVPHHEGGMAGQSKSFAVFARRALGLLADPSYEVVVATSSRLMTATLGALAARRLRAPLYLDLRDIFLETISEVSHAPASWILSALLSPIERWTVSQASLVNLVSPGFAAYFEPRFPGRTFSYHTNGIDDEFLSGAGDGRPHAASSPRPGDPLRVVYAGNIGESQGLHRILPALAHAMHGRAVFKIIGDGGRRKQLVRCLQQAGVDNVQVLPPIPRSDLIDAYRNADVLFLHLSAHNAFKRVLPSKVFEYAASTKPIWAGVGGFAAGFISREVTNAAVFAPGDVKAALSAFDRLRLSETDRPDFVRKYGREEIVRRMARQIISLAPRG